MSQISNLKSKNYAIIVAGGSGARMQSEVPKQFLLLNDKPVLMHTIEAFNNTHTRPSIILVLNKDYQKYWSELCANHHFNIEHQIVSGGETRFHSVKNALANIKDLDALVAIHDAVRPLTDKEIIDKSYQFAHEHGNAVVAVQSRDSVRQVKGDRSINLLRDEIFLVQTPQTFKLSLILKAYQQPYQSNFTDDASVAEQNGININLIDGSYQNIKITFPEDIAIAEFLLKKMATKSGHTQLSK